MILVSHTDAARIASVTRRTIRRWVATGRITRHPGSMLDLDEVLWASARARPRIEDWQEVLRDRAHMS